jgi:uncharacterized protein YukE
MDQQTLAHENAMVAASDAAKTAASGLREAITMIQQNVGESHRGWQSEGAQFFRMVMEEFAQDYLKMIDDLHHIEASLAGNAKKFAASIHHETDNVKRFQDLLGSA